MGGLAKLIPSNAELRLIHAGTIDVDSRSTLGRLRAVELAGTVLLLGAAVPIVAVCAPVLALAYRSTPFIAHRRVGKDGEPFWMLKLRTMVRGKSLPSRRFELIERIEAEPEGGIKISGDPRIQSTFAAYCRRFSVDELPQLWHVLTGKMSLVGPRPLTALELTRYYGSKAREVLSVRPGLTGLWQIQGRSALTMEERVRMDIELVRSLSFGLYFNILLRTVFALLDGTGAW